MGLIYLCTTIGFHFCSFIVFHERLLCCLGAVQVLFFVNGAPINVLASALEDIVPFLGDVSLGIQPLGHGVPEGSRSPEALPSSVSPPHLNTQYCQSFFSLSGEQVLCLATVLFLISQVIANRMSLGACADLPL